MRKISSTRYLVNNKKKNILLLLIIIIAIFCISTIMTLVSSLYSTCKNVNVDIFNYFTIINEKNDNVENWLSSNKDDIEFFEIYVTTTEISTILGSTNSYVVAVDDNDMTNILEKLNIECSNGKLPQMGRNEIFINKYVAKNKKLKVGDTLGKFKISGIFDGSKQMSFCYKKEFENMFGKCDLSYLIIPKNDIETINKRFNERGGKIDCTTKESQKENLDKEFENINLIMDIIIIMVSISLSIAVAAFVYTTYANRMEEFAIYYAVGYGIDSIVKLIIKETGLISIIAYAIGNIFSLIILKVIDFSIYSPLGQTMKIFSIKNSLFTLIIPLLVVLFSNIPVIFKLLKVDLLMLIERR